MFTCNSSIASKLIGATPVRPPGEPAKPKELLKIEPSMVILFNLLSWPPKELPFA
jgi:hypothetical protein